LNLQGYQKVTQEPRIEAGRVRPNYCNVLIDAGGQDARIHLAAACHRTSGDIEQNVVWFHVNVCEFVGVFLGQVHDTVMMETVVVDVLTANERDIPTVEIHTSSAARSGATADLSTYGAEP
jgi:hypothetical protein